MKFEFFIALSTRPLIFSTFSTVYGFPLISKEATVVLKTLFSSSATLVSSSIISSFPTDFILLPSFPLLENRGYTVFENFRLSETTDRIKLLKNIFLSFLYNLFT